MASAKDIIIKPISSQDGNRIIKQLHYSGKVVQNSQLHFGAFLDGKCGGALSFGPSLDKRKIIGLVEGTNWNGFIELNRMALSDLMPKNSGSRVLSVCMRLIRKHYPHVKWVVSFADGTQCGHGTQYQAAGFVLTGVSVSHNICKLKNGQVFHKMSLEAGSNGNSKYKRYDEFGRKSYWELTDGTYNFRKFAERLGATILPGFQLRYIYFLDPTAKERLTVPILPYSKIDEMGARMYKGKSVGSIAGDAMGFQSIEGGSTPTPTLHNKEAVKA